MSSGLVPPCATSQDSAQSSAYQQSIETRSDTAINAVPFLPSALVDGKFTAGFCNVQGLPVECSEPPGELYGIPLSTLLNLLDLVKRSRPIPVESLLDCYRRWYGSPLASAEQLAILLQVLEDNRLLARVHIDQGHTMVVLARLEPTSHWQVGRKRRPCTYSFDTPQGKEWPVINGEVAYTNGTSTFQLVHPQRPRIDIGQFTRAGPPIIEASHDYVYERNGKQYIVKARRPHTTESHCHTEDVYWVIQFEDSTTGICKATDLVPCEGTGLAPFRVPIRVWPTGRKPYQSEFVSLKVLDELETHSLVCCYSDKNVITKYRLTVSPSKSITIDVITWGGRSYLSETDANILGVSAAPAISMDALPQSNSIHKVLRGDLTGVDKLVPVFFVADLMLRHGIRSELCKDMFLL